jgi:hypothetical protein
MLMAEVEDAVNLLWAKVTPPVVALAVSRRLLLGQRIDILIDVLSAPENSTPGAGDMLELLNRAKKLAEHRNVVAHNAPAAHVYMTPDLERIQEVVVRISSNRGKKEVDMPRLRELLAEADSVGRELHRIACGDLAPSDDHDVPF